MTGQSPALDSLRPRMIRRIYLRWPLSGVRRPQPPNTMNTLSLKLPVSLPRVWLLLAALLIPQLVSAGHFYTPIPTSASVGTTISGYWAGSVGTTAGITAYSQVKAPGSSTWTTVGSGVSTHYGAAYVSYNFAYSSPGTWEIRIYVPATGSSFDYRTTVVY